MSSASPSGWRRRIGAVLGVLPIVVPLLAQLWLIVALRAVWGPPTTVAMLLVEGAAFLLSFLLWRGRQRRVPPPPPDWILVGGGAGVLLAWAGAVVHLWLVPPG